jgi:MerR family transcriptional regulator, light-induced transcriptional regulator
MAEPRYRIGAVARLAGLSTHALRVWERRYGVPSPSRSEGGARLYSEAEVERLKLLKRAVDRGHAISQLVPLGRTELERLAGGDAGPARSPNASAAALIAEFVEAAQTFDAARAELLLERAELAFSARDLVLEVLSPLLSRIGDAWAKGTLCTASEHVASALIRDRTSQLLRRLPREPGALLVAVATPAGELHELGALFAATTARMQGFDVLYLGPNLPASEIALAARIARAALVALSVLALDSSGVEHEIRALMRELPAGVDLVIGGAGAFSVAARVPGVTAFGALDEFERFLTKRREAAALPH